MKKKQLATAAALKAPIRVVLAEDNTGFRKSLQSLIEGEGDIEVVGQAKNGLQAVRLAEKLRPEVVVTDIAMPIMNGLGQPDRSSNSLSRPGSSFFPRTPSPSISNRPCNLVPLGI